MKNIHITLQPLSLLVGAAMIGVIGLTVSATPPAGGPTGRDAQLVTIDGQPAARDMVVIHQGSPYTVPAGKILLITQYGDSGVLDVLTAGVNVDGVGVVKRRAFCNGGVSSYDIPSLHPISGGYPVHAGSIVEPWCNQSETGVAIGHLEDA
jgi:hypothetical protein